ncbi:MAG: glycosyltransferase family 2 protein [Lachnospiraceae bacterium]|nr:glycosyltransferase family 2 protein [Lachnospiraceae bacterium]
MNKGINLIMPMGGGGVRFFDNGYKIPKPLLEINGKPFFYWATQSISKFVSLKSLTFVVLQDHIDNFKIDEEIYKFYPEANIVTLNHILNGAVLTCLEGVKGINNDAPIIFNDCDHLFRCSSFIEFCERGNFQNIDGALLTFTSTDPKFSFLQYDEAGNVVKTVEKVAISEDAICGAYYFKNKDIFARAVETYLQTCQYKEFFVSGVYNIMAKQKMIIKGFPVDFHLPFGTPDEYMEAKDSKLFSEVE